MASMKQFPPVLLLRATGLALRRKIHFPKDTLGEIVTGETEDYRVIRKMVVDGAGDQIDRPGATFQVDFHFARFSPAANRRLSRIPMPLIAAQPGFRSKTWLEGIDTGAFRGFYEWDTVTAAEDYWTSLPMRLMKRRAVPDTLQKQIRSVP